jgi:glucose-6-phosphate 1-epimerase
MIVNILGSQLISAQIIENEDVFYLSPYVNGNDKLRGGVPIIFPQFGSYGPLKKHGFARDLEWCEVFSYTFASIEQSCYILDINKHSTSNWPFDTKLFLTFELVKNVSLEIKFKVVNCGDKSFTFTGGLHPYFAIKSRKDVIISGIHNIEFIDTDPFIDTFILDGNTPLERLFLTKTEISLFNGYRLLNLTVEGFDNWMIWNPGKSGSKNILDLPDEDWDKFICIEPLVCNKPVTLSPMQTFIGNLSIKISKHQ